MPKEFGGTAYTEEEALTMWKAQCTPFMTNKYRVWGCQVRACVAVFHASHKTSRTDGIILKKTCQNWRLYLRFMPIIGCSNTVFSWFIILFTTRNIWFTTFNANICQFVWLSFRKINFLYVQLLWSEIRVKYTFISSYLCKLLFISRIYELPTWIGVL